MDNGGDVTFIYISHVKQLIQSYHSCLMTHYCVALTVFSKQKTVNSLLVFFFFTKFSRESEKHQIYSVIASVCEEVGEATKLEPQDGGRMLEQAEK